jgi:hypothetical protein
MPAAAVDPRLTERQVAILRYLCRQRRGRWASEIAKHMKEDDFVAVHTACVVLRRRWLVRYGSTTGWRFTAAGRKAIGARPLPPRRRGDELRGGGRP